MHAGSVLLARLLVHDRRWVPCERHSDYLLMRNHAVTQRPRGLSAQSLLRNLRFVLALQHRFEPLICRIFLPDWAPVSLDHLKRSVPTYSAFTKVQKSSANPFST